MTPKSGNRFSDRIMLKQKSMIPKMPAPGHSRPKDSVALLSYDSEVGTDFRKRSCSNKKLLCTAVDDARLALTKRAPVPNALC